MMLIADTRPRSRGGVTDCRKVVVEITHRIGPTPSRKKLRPASHGLGMKGVDATPAGAARPATGPRPPRPPPTSPAWHGRRPPTVRDDAPHRVRIPRATGTTPC